MCGTPINVEFLHLKIDKITFVGVGIKLLLVLAISIYPYCWKHLSGGWRRVYVTGSVTALYLNFFVPIVQSFQKVTILHELAPTQSEPLFLVAQVLAFAAFVAAGWVSVIRLKQVPAI